MLATTKMPDDVQVAPWPPGTDAPEHGAKRVIVLPGNAYPIDAPLLFWIAFGLHEDGWFVHAARWQNPPQDPEFVQRVLERALHTAPDADQTLLVAKSLGTLAAPAAAERGLPAVWLTPVLTNTVVADVLSSYPQEQLVVGGSADPLWPSDARVPIGEVMYVEGADHAMHVGGERSSNAVHLDVVDRVRAFAQHLVR